MHIAVCLRTMNLCSLTHNSQFRSSTQYHNRLLYSIRVSILGPSLLMPPSPSSSSSSSPSSSPSYIVSNIQMPNRTEFGARGQRTCDFTSPTYAYLLYDFYIVLCSLVCKSALYGIYRQYSLAPNRICVCIVHTSLI
jgi:hypothetical protein